MKKKEIIYFVIFLICLLFLIFLFVFSRKQNKLFTKLEKEGIIDTAVIVRDHIGTKNGLCYEYIFYVDNAKYNGFLPYSPSYGSISIGDSCLVKYLPEDPDNVNELLSYKNYRLMKIKSTRSPR